MPVSDKMNFVKAYSEDIPPNPAARSLARTKNKYAQALQCHQYVPRLHQQGMTLGWCLFQSCLILGLIKELALVLYFAISRPNAVH